MSNEYMSECVCVHMKCREYIEKANDCVVKWKPISIKAN